MDNINNLSAIPEVDIPTSPIDQVIDAQSATNGGTSDKTVELLSGEMWDKMKSQLLHHLAVIFNSQIRHFFEAEFDEKLEAIIEQRFNETGALNSTVLNNSVACSNDHEGRIKTLEDIYKPLDGKLDKINTKFDSILKEIEEKNKEMELLHQRLLDEKTAVAEKKLSKIKQEIKSIQDEHKKFVEQVDENLASNLQNDENKHLRSPDYEAEVEQLKEQVFLLWCQADKQEQYGRQYILEFRGIPYQGRPGQKEDTTDVIINFSRIHFGIHINRRDISTSHRMPIAAERRKEGKKYIPAIYCKFLNRSLVHAILKKKHLLQHCHNQELEVRENLTPYRRNLKERIDEELTSFRFKWVKHGDLFVKRNHSSKAIRVNTHTMLNSLLASQNSPNVQRGRSITEEQNSPRRNLPSQSSLETEAPKQIQGLISSEFPLPQASSPSYANIAESTPKKMAPRTTTSTNFTRTKGLMQITPLKRAKNTVHPTVFSSVFKFKGKSLVNRNLSISI